ncbi:NACHT and ankyrin domain-containing protein [Colletotrichum truncatum]|uniref:NACHT and ankyrin domain-containing protein n=1 Tax=Colletotrichum truncatum TaxID=5467 RepID=A0ACC3YQ85_COLTU|nr:NACHT and ankyrin domain-containing protein [Colletotrichum truncatum]KAF6796653.1 NACHT and ankyrin domain-containing protein [Colletotrichum truncatum]
MQSERSFQDHECNMGHSKRPKIFDMAHGSGSHTAHVTRYSFRRQDYTIAWVCALSLELASSRAMLDEEHPSLPVDRGDSNSYVLGRMGEHNVVMACLPGQYGTNNAAIVTTNLNRSFPQIRATLMVGIGGGSPSQADLYLGDVVVGIRVMQYDLGKLTANGGFQGTADAKTPAKVLDHAVSLLKSLPDPGSQIKSILIERLPNISRPTYPDRLFQASYEHPLGAPTCDECDTEKLQLRRARLSTEPKVHHGVIASGNLVMKNGKARDDIAQLHTALCFEMEAAGMMDHFQCLPIRGICDYSDSHKNKEWQDYAAATAAAYARALLKVLPPVIRELDQHVAGHGKASNPDTTDEERLERRERLLKSLGFPEMNSRRTTVEAAYAKTCRWIMQHSEYQNWINPEMQCQHHGFLWMRGKAGAGKSTMVKFIFSEMKRNCTEPNMATASFFFHARGDYLERSIIGVYRSLLFQLLTKFSDLQLVLDDTDIIPWDQEACPNLNILKELLRSAVMALGQRTFTCFIDALDESDEEDVRDMVHFFEDLAEQTTETGIRFRICMSSRPYPYIDIRKGILLTLENEAGHRDDLAQYVENHLRITNTALLEEIQAKILGKADGIFMWVVMVVGILNKENSHGGLALRRRISEFPAKLGNLFKSILTRDQDRPEELLLCVLWVLCARRPLSPREFQHALWAGLSEQGLVDPDLPSNTEMDAVRLVTSSSKGLAEITKSKEPKVQFIHQSVSDFLVKEKGLQNMWPELGFDWEGTSHERLKRCCATYLSIPKVQKLIKRPRSKKEERVMAEKYPFLDYATQQVLHHADMAALVVSQDHFLQFVFSSAGIGLIKFFERHKPWAYSTRVAPLYVLADKGLGNLIRIQMKRERAVYTTHERHGYPFFAALANVHKDAVAALLCLPSITCDGVDIMAGLSHGGYLAESEGRTPLSWASQEGRLGIAKALVEAGAEINEVDPKGHTPLRRASIKGHEAVASFLVGKGADMDSRDDREHTALSWAIREGKEAVMRFLIEKGADINTRDKDGYTSLSWASKNGKLVIVKHLIRNGADINTQDMYGNTALSWAVRQGKQAVAKLLIEKGANINI